MPMLGFLKGQDARPIANGFQTIGEYLRGHVGFWGTHTGGTNIFGFLTVTHNCGFVPDKIFVQRVHDASSPVNSYGGTAIYPTLIDENVFYVQMINLDGTIDISSGNRTINYHILPKVNE